MHALPLGATAALMISISTSIWSEDSDMVREIFDSVVEAEGVANATAVSGSVSEVFLFTVAYLVITCCINAKAGDTADDPLVLAVAFV